MTRTEIRKLILTSSTTSRYLWSHPTLDLFAPPIEKFQPQRAILFTHPSTFGESFDDDDLPKPTSAEQLPDIEKWTMSLAISALEIIAGRRQPAQVAMRCHRVIYNELVGQIGRVKEIGKIRRIHQESPFDGIVESTITVRFSDRVRALALRAEGVDGRWLCTALSLL